MHLHVLHRDVQSLLMKSGLNTNSTLEHRRIKHQWDRYVSLASVHNKLNLAWSPPPLNAVCSSFYTSQRCKLWKSITLIRGQPNWKITTLETGFKQSCWGTVDWCGWKASTEWCFGVFPEKLACLAGSQRGKPAPLVTNVRQESGLLVASLSVEFRHSLTHFLKGTRSRGRAFLIRRQLKRAMMCMLVVALVLQSLDRRGANLLEI